MDTIKITIYCVGDQSNRSINIPFAKWIEFLNFTLENNPNMHKWALDPYRKVGDHELYMSLYNSLLNYLNIPPSSENIPS